MVLRFVLSSASMIGELERIAGQCDGVRCDKLDERPWSARDFALTKV